MLTAHQPDPSDPSDPSDPHNSNTTTTAAAAAAPAAAAYLCGAAVIADRQQHAAEQREQRRIGDPLRAKPRGEAPVLAKQLTGTESAVGENGHKGVEEWIEEGKSDELTSSASEIQTRLSQLKANVITTIPAE